MTMNRVIHAAVRRDLQRLATALDHRPDGDRARGGELERAFANLRAELHQAFRAQTVWVTGTMIAVAGVIIAAVKLLP